jgi:predicted DNA-binding antitoxin AbrB/MazE fold protein
MSEPIHAVFESGVFRPLEPVELPPGTPAEVIPHIQSTITERGSWPTGYFEHTAGALANEELERPTQGSMPQRDGW